MANGIEHDRRRFLGAAAARIATAGTASTATAQVSSDEARGPSGGFAPAKRIKAGVLEVGYHEAGPSDGPPMMLLQGFPHSVGSYVDVAPMLAARGCRVIVPHVRCHGPTRFLDDATPRSGQQAAIGVDLIALMDASGLNRAVLAGYDSGDRATCVAAALQPERCAGLVSVNSYLIQDIAGAGKPLAPPVEAGLWYQFYILTERGRAGLAANRREIAWTLWARNSPNWRFGEAALDRHASAFDNPDYVDVVVHSYRHRLGSVAGYPAYEDVERRLAALPATTVQTITLDGGADSVVPATDGTATAAKFTGERRHRVVPSAGHNLPEEAPDEFADAVWELAPRKH